jgi:hypothetical protein
MRRVRAGIPLLIAAAITAALAVPASGHDHAYDSTVTIREPNSFDFKGRVKSGFDACEPHRLVKLFQDNAGPDDPKVDDDETDGEGRWAIEVVGQDYYAKVTRKVLTPGSHRHVCRGDTSPTI